LKSILYSIVFIITFFPLSLFASISEFEKYIQKEIEDKTPPSASFAILEGNKIVYIKSIGYNDANMTQKTDTQSVYHVYSLTKIFTASIVMKLIEKGKINLDDSIKKYFPNFNLRYQGKDVDITILNLLNHSSGITDNSPEIQNMFQENNSNSYLSLPYMPGSEAKYSNTEYIILGRIIEKVTNEDFDAIVKDYILDPTNMTHSGFTYNHTMSNNQVFGTIKFFSLTGLIMKFILDDGNKNFYQGSTLWLKEFDIKWQAAGGLVSSITDMAKFLSAYHSNHLFLQRTKNIFIKTKSVQVDSWLSSQEDVSFGIGWYHIYNEGKFFYQHQGLGPGFRTIIRIYPAYDTSIIILTSQTSVDIDTWADKLIDNIISEHTKNIDLF